SRSAASPSPACAQSGGFPPALPSRSASVGQSQHPLGDDVELDFAGAALDRHRARTQPAPRARELLGRKAFALPTQPLKAAYCPVDLAPPFAELGADELQKRAFRSGCAPGLDRFAGSA